MPGCRDAAGWHPVNHLAVLPILMLCVLGVAPFYAGLSFLSGSLQASPAKGIYPVSKAVDMPRTSDVKRGASQWRMQKDRPGHLEWVGIVALGVTLVASAARPRLASGGVSHSKAARQSRGVRGLIACRAAEEEEEGTSILSGLSMENDEAGDVTLDGAGFDDELNLTDDALDDDEPEEEEDNARFGMMRQQKYTLGPSRQYVLYIAKKNALKTWTKDGRAGPGTNFGCLEVQIAMATEKIRSMVLHIREFPHDLRCRNRLISLVARRRKMLDKLSWTDVDRYINIRDTLKIRHVYRMEALIGRYAPYKYTQENRKQAPGRKIVVRLKKTKRLLNKRLANQLRQGKPEDVIFRTKKMIKSRSWASRAYDEAEGIINNKPTPPMLDPLNLP